MEISVTRGLAELKLLDKRINDSMQCAVIGVQQGQKKISEQFDKDVFEKSCKSAFDSVKDLIERRKKIKSAIVASNATVKVKIGGTDMTVAEAIERKTAIKYEQTFLASCKSQLSSCLKTVESGNEKVKQRLDALLQQNFGKDAKANDSDVDSISKPFMTNNELKLIDPLGLKSKIDEMEKSIDGFLSEVDYVLSESNTITKITI
jgi:hypothetical protein